MNFETKVPTFNFSWGQPPNLAISPPSAVLSPPATPGDLRASRDPSQLLQDLQQRHSAARRGFPPPGEHLLHFATPPSSHSDQGGDPEESSGQQRWRSPSGWTSPSRHALRLVPGSVLGQGGKKRGKLGGESHTFTIVPVARTSFLPPTSSGNCLERHRPRRVRARSTAILLYNLLKTSPVLFLD